MSPARKADTRLVVGAPPRANLLPPEVLADEKFGKLRSRLLLGLVAVVAVVVIAFAGASLLVTQSMAKLTAANNYTLELLTEQAKYIEVRNLSDQIEIAEKVLLMATVREVDWKEYVDLVQASLPAGTIVTVVSGSLASNADEATADPLLPASIAEFTFTATSATLPDVPLWLDNIAKIPGFIGAVPPAVVTLQDDGRYSVAFTIQLNEEAFANRLAEAEEEEDGE